MLATRLAVQFGCLPHVAKDIHRVIRSYIISQGIQLLSPDSIDPARPLQNGFLATTMDDSLRLLRTWIDECEDHHHTTCRPIETVPGSRVLPARIRAIGVDSHALVEIDPAVSQYATLSYVWGENTAAYIAMAASLAAAPIPRLPDAVPQLILDAITVCTSLAIPYLWVDLYYIHQTNPALKSIEITLMGQIYRFSTITLVAGSATHASLLPSPDAPPSPSPLQLTATIPAHGHNHTFIAQPPTLFTRLQSPWAARSWTFQEGNLARRLAFFDPPHTPSFLYGSGYFSPTLHSGPYGHTARLPTPYHPPADLPPLLDLRSGGFHVLAGHKWLATSNFDFDDYARIVHDYSRRELSFESDKLKALEGCLKAIGERKGVEFLWGTPTAGFHYALLWTGENEGRRDGFPSWCWAGWVTRWSTSFLVKPSVAERGLVKGEDGGWSWEGGEVEGEVVVRGLLTWGAVDVGKKGLVRCRERLAGVKVGAPGFETVRVESEGVRFWVEFRSKGGQGCKGVCCEILRDGGVEALEDETMYRVSIECGVYLRDRAGNVYYDNYMWLSRWPLYAAKLPLMLSGKELRRLMEDGLELIRIVDIESVEGQEGTKPFRHVLCLGVDRIWDEGAEGRGRRMGMFSLPGEMWEKAGPEKMAVELW